MPVQLGGLRDHINQIQSRMIHNNQQSVSSGTPECSVLRPLLNIFIRIKRTSIAPDLMEEIISTQNGRLGTQIFGSYMEQWAILTEQRETVEDERLESQRHKKR